jgi:hypothetical protein
MALDQTLKKWHYTVASVQQASSDSSVSFASSGDGKKAFKAPRPLDTSMPAGRNAEGAAAAQGGGEKAE